MTLDQLLSAIIPALTVAAPVVVSLVKTEARLTRLETIIAERLPAKAAQ